MKLTLLLVPLFGILLTAAPALADQSNTLNTQEQVISVLNQNNDSTYQLAVGETGVFTEDTTLNVLRTISDFRQNLAKESTFNLIQSPVVWSYVLVMYALAFAFGFLYRFILKTFAKGTARGVTSNIGRYDRAIRLAAWLGLLIWAITTSWSPWLLFFSGFALFEALFSWCGLYAALGRNTCPS